MPFEDLVAPTRANAKGCCMSAQELKRGGVKITLTVPLDILPGKPKADGETRYAVGYGTGDDRGWLRLAPAKDGSFQPTLMKAPFGPNKGKPCAARFNLGEPAFAPDGAAKRTVCAHKAEGGGLLIALPSWAFLPPEFDAEQEAE